MGQGPAGAFRPRIVRKDSWGRVSNFARPAIPVEPGADGWLVLGGSRQRLETGMEKLDQTGRPGAFRWRRSLENFQEGA